MAKDKVTINLDLGNSETRAEIMWGEFKGTTRNTCIIELDNRLATPFRLIERLGGDLDTESKYNADNSVIFEVSDATIGGTPVNKSVVAGLMAELEYSMVFSSPDVLQPKYSNEFTLFNTIRVLYETVKFIKENGNFQMSLSDLAKNLEFELTILLPPEQAVQDNTLKFDLCNIPEIKFLLPNEKIKFNVADVHIQQEGYTAFYGTFLDRRTKKVRPELKSAMAKRVLLIDIGKGTTDLMLIDRMRVLESSKRTLVIGGANVLSTTRYILSKETGNSYMVDNFEESLLTGVVSDGNTQTDISDYVNEAKYNVAYRLIEEIKEYLLANQIVPSSISQVLVVGGGTMPAKNDKIQTLGHFVHEHFSKITPKSKYIDINAIDTRVFDEDGEMLYDTDKYFSARNVNLIGSGILTDIRDLKKLEEEA